MPEHILEKHINCERPYCAICEGGLANCTVCAGAEGSMPTDCPGVRMTPAQCDAVYAAKLDYRDGEGWVNRPAKHWEHITALNAERNRLKRNR
jgi:hypothetical protein